MRRRKLLVALTALVFSGFASLAAGQTPPTPGYTENGFTPVLLDTSASTAARTKAFAKVISLANQGQVRAQDLAGTLYWQGPKVPGSAVPVNLGLARRLLANAAVHGDVLAMAKMAELELADGRAPQAMVWAQLYAKYLEPLVSVRRGRGQDSAYAAALIDRIEKAGGKIDKATQINVGTMIQRFDQSIRRGIDTFATERNHGRTYLVQQPMANESVKVSNINGVAEYVVGFDQRGKPARIWPLDAFPDPSLTTVFRDHLDTIYANSVGDGEGMRYLRVSITHNASKWMKLRARN